MIYVKSPGIRKNGKINTEIGKFKAINVKVKATSEIIKKIIRIAKTLLASVKIAPLNKNSCNLDKCFSEILLSKNIVRLSIILNFMK
jgi:hypothetical protein